MTATEHVILVDENDNPIGTAEKLYAHRNHLCHRAFSVFILRNQPNIEILLQQRAKDKYHSPLLWTNTCCSHPRPGEAILDAGQRRLKEEMNLHASLHSLGSFHYIAHFDNGLVENEIDHVLIGYSDETIICPNPAEVEAYRWVSLPDLQAELEQHPEQFTPWLSQALQIVSKNIS